MQERLIRMLEAIASSGQPVSVADIASMTGVPRASVYRNVASLLECGFVDEAEGGNGYVLGLRFVRIALTGKADTHVISAAAPMLKSAVKALGETAFLARYRVALDRAVRRISNRALRALVEHDWPGNVRELQAVIEFAVIRAVGDEIGLEDLPSELSPQAASPSRNAGPPSLAPADAYDERAEIVATLQRCRGNRAKAARELGMSRATFYRRLTEFGIEPKRLRRSE